MDSLPSNYSPHHPQTDYSLHTPPPHHSDQPDRASGSCRAPARVLEGADLVVDPADHAAGRRRWVWRRGAAAAAGEWVERWGGEAQTAGPQARVEDPAAEGEDGEEDHDD